MYHFAWIYEPPHKCVDWFIHKRIHSRKQFSTEALCKGGSFAVVRFQAMSKMVSEAVDTADLSKSDDTKPVIPSQLHSEEVEGSFLKSIIVPYVWPHIEYSSFTHVPRFQEICGVRLMPKQDETVEELMVAEAWSDSSKPAPMRAVNFILSLMFHLGAFIGSEAFYIIIFPYIFWNVDARLARHMMTFWGLSMYIGQYFKDHLQLPRPFVLNKRVRSLESAWVAEYGFPSTHTIAIVGQAAIIVYETYQQDYEGKGEYPIRFALATSALVIFCTTAGRLYLGVHSVPDLVGGGVVAVTLFGVYISLEEKINNFLTKHMESMWIPPIFCVILLLAYPRLKHWSPAFGDTAVILGACNGMWITQYLFTVEALPLDWRTMPALSWFLLSTSRLVIGFGAVALIRIIVKTTMRTILLAIFGKNGNPPEERYEIDIPTKFVCYSSVSVFAIAVAPYIFSMLSLTG
eukprot:gene9330-1597_t